MSCRTAGVLGLLAVALCVSSPAWAVEGTVTDVEFLPALEGFGLQPHRYRISVTVTFSAPVTGQIVRATVNGKEVFLAKARSRQPLIDTFDAQKNHLGGEVLTGHPRAYVQFYHDWRTGEKYALGVTVRTDDGETFSCESEPAVAPEGGAHETPFPWSKALKVRDPAGLERKSWPVLIGVALDPAHVQDPQADMMLMRYDRARRQHVQVPFQVLGVTEPVYAAENVAASKGSAPPLHLFEICFLADLDAGGAGNYFLHYGRPERAMAQPPIAGPQITYRESPEGLVVDTGPAAFRFDPASGQLSGYVPKLAGYEEELKFVQNERRPIHWNPDVWAPPSPWGHTSDWGTRDFPKPEARTVQGPLCYRTVHTGTMPWSNGTRALVSYTLFAGMPFILETSCMEFTAPTAARAVRSNELVFNRGMHTDAVWLDEAGGVSVRPCYDLSDRNRFFGRPAQLPPDIPLVGLIHSQHAYGIASVTLSLFSLSPAGPPPDAESHYYVNDPGLFGTGDQYHMNFTYICRAYVFRDTVVPAGTLYGEYSAFLVFELDDGEDRYASMKRWAELLRGPAVKVEVADVVHP